MPKISNLPETQVDGTETVVVLKDGIAKRAILGGFLAALQEKVDTAVDVAVEATAGQTELAIAAAMAVASAQGGYWHHPVTNTRYVFAQVDGGFGSAVAPHYWVDFDAAPGGDGSAAAPFNDLHPLEALGAELAGKTVAVRGGPTWRRTGCILYQDQVSIVGYDGLVRMDGSDPIDSGEWSAHPSVANAYSADLPVEFVDAIGNEFAPAIYQDGTPLTIKGSAADVGTTPGSMYFGLTGSSGVQSVTIHPFGSGNPASDGSSYAVASRESAIRLGHRGMLHGLYARRYAGHNGGIKIGDDMRVSRCLVEGCGGASYASGSVAQLHHSWVIGDGVAEDLFAVNALDYTIIGTAYHDGVAEGKTFSLTRGGFIFDPSAYTHATTNGSVSTSAFYAHGTGGSFDRITLRDVSMIGIATGGGPVTKRLVHRGLYARSLSGAPINDIAAPVELDDSLIINCGYITNGVINATIRRLLNFQSVSGLGVYPLGYATTNLEIRDSMFVLASSASVNAGGVYAVNGGYNGTVNLTVTNTIFDGHKQPISVGAATKNVTARYNLYRVADGTSLIFNVDGVQKTFAEWQGLFGGQGSASADPDWAVAKPSLDDEPNSLDPTLDPEGSGHAATRANFRITYDEVAAMLARPSTLAQVVAYLEFDAPRIAVAMPS